MSIELGTLVAFVGTIAGLVFGYSGYQRNKRQDNTDDTKAHVQLRSDVAYIRLGIDDIRIDLRAQELRVTDLASAVIRLEESTKSAHKRIDKNESRIEKLEEGRKNEN